MSDQAPAQSIESRLMAFVDEENDAPVDLDADEQPEVEAIETNPDEQVEEEASAQAILDKLKLLGKGNLYQFDRDIMSMRTPAAKTQATA